MGLDHPRRVLPWAPPCTTASRRGRDQGRGRLDDAVHGVSALLTYRLGAFR